MEAIKVKGRASTRRNGKILQEIGRAIDHGIRSNILAILEGETFGLTVTQIYIKLRLEQSVASQHLAILRRAGLVATERQGKFIYYSLAVGMDEVLASMMKAYKNSLK